MTALGEFVETHTCRMKEVSLIGFQGQSLDQHTEDEYVAFKFKRKHVGEFWANVCTNENQAKYNLFQSPDLRFLHLICKVQD